jgi:hypothetical protein
VLNIVSKPAGNAGYVAFQDTGFVKVAGDDIAGLVLCDAKGNIAEYGANQLAGPRPAHVGGRSFPSVTRDFNTIQTNVDLLNNGSCP